MSEGIFGKNADLAQRLKDRIAFHANEHRHNYEIGKGVTEKRGRYHDYGKALETARARTKGERGFWEQARLVKGGEDHDVP